jgi:hypothetical protein
MSTDAGRGGDLGRIIRGRTIGVPPPYEGAVIKAAEEAYALRPARHRLAIVVAVALALGFAAGLVFGRLEARAVDGCRPEPITASTPTGIAGCVRYGTGIASRWPGPGVARNDCTWPWDACRPIVITALDTGRQVIVTPRMFCDCYTGTADERLVDLDPAAVAALGLTWDAGLYRVSVEPASIAPMASPTPLLPDTAVAP